MTAETMFPEAVYTLWRVTVVLTLVVFIPLSVYLLHSLWRAVRSIRDYSRETLVAAKGIEAATSAIPATNDTIAVATELLAAAESVASKLDAMASALEARVRRA